MKLSETLLTSAALLLVTTVWLALALYNFLDPVTFWVEKPMFYFFGMVGLWVGTALNARTWNSYREERSREHKRRR